MPTFQLLQLFWTAAVNPELRGAAFHTQDWLNVFLLPCSNRHAPFSLKKNTSFWEIADVVILLMRKSAIGVKVLSTLKFKDRAEFVQLCVKVKQTLKMHIPEENKTKELPHWLRITALTGCFELDMELLIKLRPAGSTLSFWT